MIGQNPTQTSGGGGTDFFGSLLSTATRTIDAFAPIWVSKELDLQSTNQLASPTFDRVAAPRRADGGFYMPAVTSQQSAYGSASNSGFNMSPMNMMLIGLGLVAVVLIAKEV